MSRIGFKIDNCNNEKNLEYAQDLFKYADNYPIEVGLECYEDLRSCKLDSNLLNLVFKNFLNRSNPNIIHMSLKAKVLNKEEFTENEWLSIWKNQFDKIKDKKISYIVLHATSIESRILEEEEQIEIINRNFKKIKNLSPFPIFIENTYEDLDFYERLFDKADKEINFVLDIGHKKVHSKRSNEDWILFLSKLEKEGRKLHFHIHDNNGLNDQHDPINKNKNKFVLEFIKTLKNKFTKSNFIIEIHGNDLQKAIKDFRIIKAL